MEEAAKDQPPVGDEGHQALFEDVGKKVESLDQESDVKRDGDDMEEQDQRLVEEIESLCMNCQENGTTRILLARIPYFREIILMSFSCPHCNFQNAEIQSAGQIQERGCRYTFALSESSDLQRQVVKSDTCVVKFKELDVEIPAGRGQLTNVEGLLSALVEDLALQQPTRETLDPEAHAKIENIVENGRKMLAGEKFPFSLILDDPAGNSWIEPSMHGTDKKLSRSEYKRTREQNEELSLVAPETGDDDQNEGSQGEMGKRDQENARNGEDDIVPDEVYSFQATCPGCGRPCSTHMKMVDIPHFKECVIMSTVCEQCGYRSNEVKTGGAVPSKGRRITLEVRNPEDLTRDILKSETCALSSPELSLSVTPGTMGGRFTTVEGLLTQVRDDLHGQIFDMSDVGRRSGDSLPEETRNTWTSFFATLDKALKGEMPFTVTLEDPWAGSYVQSLSAPDPDPQISIEDYERTEEENEDLGLNDIKVDGY
ncbi:MAG: hypothetical protein M1823_005555 [Watsoniomyces obsoletus]|nr:MAG: hypothetical protein M1823_005555 [Watsoniomyces obsoletus]